MPLLVGGFIVAVLAIAVLAVTALVVAGVVIGIIVLGLLIEFTISPFSKVMAACAYILLAIAIGAVLPYDLYEGAKAHGTVTQQQDAVGYGLLLILAGVMLLVPAVIHLEERWGK